MDQMKEAANWGSLLWNQFSVLLLSGTMVLLRRRALAALAMPGAMRGTESNHSYFWKEATHFHWTFRLLAETYHRLGLKLDGVAMAAIARAFNRALPATSSLEVGTLTQLALLAGAGLLVSFVLMTYGLDLSAGFFWPQNAQRRTSGISSLGGAGLGAEPSNPPANRHEP
jgi:hypothetical protein